MKQEQLLNSLMNIIDKTIAELLSPRSSDKQSINYHDAGMVSGKIRNIFSNILDKIPPQIETVCNLSEAILAPSAKEKKNKIKAVMAIAGTTGGMAMIIGGIGTALGWGAGVVAAVVAFFVGAPMAGPVGWITAGVALSAISGYLALSGDDATNSERYIKVLKNGLQEAMPSIWSEYEEQLSKVSWPVKAETTTDKGADALRQKKRK